MKKLIKHVKKWFEWATDPCNGNNWKTKILVLFGAPAPTFSVFITRKEWEEVISPHMSGMGISISDYKKIKKERDKYSERR